MEAVRTCTQRRAPLAVIAVAAGIVLAVAGVPAAGGAPSGALAPEAAVAADANDSLAIRGMDTTDVSADAFDVATVIGLGGNTLYADVTVGDRVVARDMSYAYDEASDQAGVVQLNSKKDVVAKYSGRLSLSFYANGSKSRSDGEAALYTASVYAVCMRAGDAAADDVAGAMIGARTCAAGDETAAITVPRLLVRDGKTYRVKGGSTSVTPTLENGVLYVDYEEVASAGVAAQVTYVDENDNTIYTDQAGTLSDDQSVTVSVLKTVESGSKVYVPLTRSATLTLTAANPEVTVHCVTRKEASRATNTVSITYVDADGKQLMADSQEVTSGGFNYVPPKVFSQARDGSTMRYVLTGASDNRGGSYSADEAASLSFTYDGASAYTLTYAAEKVQLTYSVSLALVAPGNDGYLNVSIDQVKTAVFADGEDAVVELPATLEKDGYTYTRSGSDSSLTYTWADFEAGALNSDTVYYTRSDVKTPSAYNVTVRYVDVASGTELGSQTLACTPEGGAVSISGPESLDVDGTSYVRLSGQEAAITHRFYAPYRTYTIYYGLPGTWFEGDTTVTRTVVTDGGVTYYRVNSAMGAVSTTGTGTNGAATGGLNAATPYTTVVNGTGNDTADGEDGGNTGETRTDVIAPDGTSASEERIEDSETPLAQTTEGGIQPWAIGVAVALAVGLAALLALFTHKRRDSRKEA